MLNRAFREEVAGLSSGRYYDEVSHWYNALLGIFDRYGCEAYTSICPQVYNNDGSFHVCFDDVNGKTRSVYVTYHRMQSFRWEIICYVC